MEVGEQYISLEELSEIRTELQEQARLIERNRQDIAKQEMNHHKLEHRVKQTEVKGAERDAQLAELNEAYITKAEMKVMMEAQQETLAYQKQSLKNDADTSARLTAIESAISSSAVLTASKAEALYKTFGKNTVHFMGRFFASILIMLGALFLTVIASIASQEVSDFIVHNRAVFFGSSYGTSLIISYIIGRKDKN